MYGTPYLSSGLLVPSDGLLYEIFDQYFSTSTGNNNPGGTKTHRDFHCTAITSPVIEPERAPIDGKTAARNT